MKNILILFFCALSAVVVAQNIPADRPGQTQNATTAQAGSWIIQTAGEFGGFVNTDNGKGFESWGFPLDVRYGITNRFEVMASGKALFASTQGTGAGIEYSLLSYALNFRFNLFDETDFGSMALLAGYEHNSYEGGIASANNFIAKVLYKLALGEKLQLATNLGFTQASLKELDHSEEDGGRFTYTAAFSYNVSDKFGLFLETYGSQGSVQSAWIDGGIYFLPNPNVQWDFVLGNGGLGDFSQYFATIGVCFQIGEPR